MMKCVVTLVVVVILLGFTPFVSSQVNGERDIYRIFLLSINIVIVSLSSSTEDQIPWRVRDLFLGILIERLKPVVTETRVLFRIDMSIEEVTWDVQFEKHQFVGLVRPSHVPADDRHIGTELLVGLTNTGDHFANIGPFDVLQLFVRIGMNCIVLFLPHRFRVERRPAWLIPMSIGCSTRESMGGLIDVVEDGVVIGLLFDSASTKDERFHFDRRRGRIARGDDANRRERSIGSDQPLNEIMIGEHFLDDPIAVVPRTTQQRSSINSLSTSKTDVAKLS